MRWATSVLNKAAVGVVAFGLLLSVGTEAGATPTPPTHGVGALEAMPDVYLAADPQLVTMSIQIAPDPALLSDNVRLYQQTAKGELGTNFGRLYDDGTHGDRVAGDNTFTTQIAVPSDLPAEFKFIVLVPYRDQAAPTLSAPVSVTVLQRPDPAAVASIAATIHSASDMIPSLVAKYGTDTARAMIVKMLQGKPNVAAAGISQDGETIWIRFTNGLPGALLINSH